MKRCLPLLIRLSRRCYVLGKFWERVTHAVSGCNIGVKVDGITKAVLHDVTNNNKIKGKKDGITKAVLHDVTNNKQIKGKGDGITKAVLHVVTNNKQAEGRIKTEILVYPSLDAIYLKSKSQNDTALYNGQISRLAIIPERPVLYNGQISRLAIIPERPVLDNGQISRLAIRPERPVLYNGQISRLAIRPQRPVLDNGQISRLAIRPETHVLYNGQISRLAIRPERPVLYNGQISRLAIRPERPLWVPVALRRWASSKGLTLVKTQRVKSDIKRVGVRKPPPLTRSFLKFNVQRPPLKSPLTTPRQQFLLYFGPRKLSPHVHGTAISRRVANKRGSRTSLKDLIHSMRNALHDGRLAERKGRFTAYAALLWKEDMAKMNREGGHDGGSLPVVHATFALGTLPSLTTGDSALAGVSGNFSLSEPIKSGLHTWVGRARYNGTARSGEVGKTKIKINDSRRETLKDVIKRKRHIRAKRDVVADARKTGDKQDMWTARRVTGTNARVMADKLLDLMSRVREGRDRVSTSDLDTHGDLWSAPGDDVGKMDLDVLGHRQPTEADRQLLRNIERLTFLVLGRGSVDPRHGTSQHKSTREGAREQGNPGWARPPEPSRGGLTLIPATDNKLYESEMNHAKQTRLPFKKKMKLRDWTKVSKSRSNLKGHRLAGSKEKKIFTEGTEFIDDRNSDWLTQGERSAKALHKSTVQSTTSTTLKSFENDDSDDNGDEDDTDDGNDNDDDDDDDYDDEDYDDDDDDDDGNDDDDDDYDNNGDDDHGRDDESPNRGRNISKVSVPGKLGAVKRPMRSKRSVRAVTLLDGFRLNWPVLRSRAIALQQRLSTMKESSKEALENLEHLLHIGKDYDEFAKKVAERERKANKMLHEESAQFRLAEREFETFQQEIATEEAKSREDEQGSHLSRSESKMLTQVARGSPGLTKDAAGEDNRELNVTQHLKLAFPKDVEEELLEHESSAEEGDDANLKMVAKDISGLLTRARMRAITSRKQRSVMETEKSSAPDSTFARGAITDAAEQVTNTRRLTQKSAFTRTDNEPQSRAGANLLFKTIRREGNQAAANLILLRKHTRHGEGLEAVGGDRQERQMGQRLWKQLQHGRRPRSTTRDQDQFLIGDANDNPYRDDVTDIDHVVVDFHPIDYTGDDEDAEDNAYDEDMDDEDNNGDKVDNDDENKGRWFGRESDTTTADVDARVVRRDDIAATDISAGVGATDELGDTDADLRARNEALQLWTDIGADVDLTADTDQAREIFNYEDVVEREREDSGASVGFAADGTKFSDDVDITTQATSKGGDSSRTLRERLEEGRPEMLLNEMDDYEAEALTPNVPSGRNDAKGRDQPGKDHAKGRNQPGKDHAKGRDQPGKDHAKGKAHPGKDVMMESVLAPGVAAMPRASILESIPSLETVEEVSSVLSQAGKDYKRELSLRDMGVDEDSLLDKGDLEPYDQLINGDHLSQDQRDNHLYFGQGGHGKWRESPITKEINRLVKHRQESDKAIDSLSEAAEMVKASSNSIDEKEMLGQEIQRTMEKLRREKQKIEIQRKIFLEEEQQKEADAIKELERTNGALMEQRLRQYRQMEADLDTAIKDQLAQSEKRARVD